MNKILVLTLCLLSFNLLALESTKTQFGRVEDIKGEGFISINGKTHEIKKGDALAMGSEIVIEHSGQVTFTDNADHRFYLGNASSARLTGKTVELREGDMWFQSLNKEDKFKVETANATVEYSGGEGIISYDSLKGRSQLLVINGVMKLSNLRTQELNLNVAEGHFSFVENSYEGGAPRDPTPVGEKTYNQLVSLFKGVSPMDKNSAIIFKDHHAKASREIASVKEEHVTPKVEVAEDHNMIEAYKESILNKKSAPQKKSVAHKVTHTTNKVLKKKTVAEKLTIHVYGLLKEAPVIAENKVEVKPEVKSRAPASVLEQEVPTETKMPPAPYNKDYQQIDKESDKLIDDLNKL